MAAADLERLTWAVFCWLVIGFGSVTVAQDTDVEEAKEKSVVDRFAGVLETNPRRGTALDKVYGYHVERGTLEALVKSYREKAQKLTGPASGAMYLVVGLLESLRGQDAAAVEALKQAETLAPQNYLASYYLGQCLVLVGQPDKAAEALERSIQRKPSQADLLDIYQALGRVYQRAQKTDQAMAVWTRLEKQFPNDLRVQEQIATTLLEENEFTAALPRYENLAKKTKDKYRQTLFQMEAAGLKVRTGKSDEAIKEFEELLAQLLPDSWLYRDVRRRIEAVYLRTDDQAGLITYYENWLKKKTDDLEAISRLARLLASSGRVPESQEWLQKGLKLAPKNKELRLALIGQLTYEGKHADVIANYEQMDKNEPNNPDTLRDWGRTILKDSSKDEPTRKQLATQIWNRMTTAKPKDPLVASQVGELFRQAQMTDEALALYRKASELAPDQSQYREYLGEYLHTLQRKEEALVEWRQIAAGNLKTPANVARLAEVLSGFGYLTEAVETNGEACKLDPKDFLLQVKQVDLLSKAEKHDEALVQLEVVKKLAANDEETEAWLSRELRELQSADKLGARVEAVRKDLAATASANKSDADKAANWLWLARAYESDRQMKDAIAAITKAGDLDPQSLPILKAAARLQEGQNNLTAAVEINSKLAAIDRRYRTEYLKQIAMLEQKLGRRDKAIQAGRDLIAAAPGNPELYEFFSQLCFQLGETEEGLTALRRSVRVNPTEQKGLLLLASALGERFRTGEAIELYWRAFERAASLEDRLAIIPKLSELYLQTNQFDLILERLERQRREPNQLREMTICLAQAYQSAGDDGNARQELEKLLTEETRDTPLLMQLSKLCETDGDIEASMKFQQQLLKAAPSREGSMRLAQLFARSGDNEEAMGIITRLTVEEKDPETVMKSLDSMLSQGNIENALRVADKLAREQPNNWELLYRKGYSLAKTKDKAEEARRVFEQLIALKIADDDQCVADKARARKSKAQPYNPAETNIGPLRQRWSAVSRIKQTTGLEEDRYNGQQPVWTPRDFGQARMASFGWITFFERKAGHEDEFVKKQREVGEKAQTRRELMDWWQLASIAGNSRDLYVVLKKLSMRPDVDPDAKLLYLSQLRNRGLAPGEEGVAVNEVDDDENPQLGSKLAVLNQEELDHVVACYKSYDPAIVNNNGELYLRITMNELKRSGRNDEAAAMRNEAVANAKSSMEISSLLNQMIDRNDFNSAMVLLNRLSDLQNDPAFVQSLKSGGNAWSRHLTPEGIKAYVCRLMDKREQKKETTDVLKVWDWFAKTAVTHYEQRKASKRSSPNFQNQRGYVQLYRQGQYQYEQLDFPQENELYEQASIQVLRQVYVAFPVERTNDLFEHFRQKIADRNTPANLKSYWKFGLAYLQWWHDDKDGALAIFTEATNELPDPTEMQFELARIHEIRGEHQEALQIIDALPVTDQKSMQKREIIAIRDAVMSGDIDRARTAAERLFGLRLDAGLQISLAQQMHQLGMHDQAEAVLARAGRQAGNKTDVLANLMQQYHSQGKNDIATQIAYQLLRRSSSNKYNANRNSWQYQNENALRQQAFTILKRSGKLPDMIAKVEAQLKNSPKSQTLTETLIEYYTANGDNKKAGELAANLTDTKQDDPQFRYNLGRQLMDQNKHAEAVPHFKVAFKKDPRLIRNNFYQIMNSFENANKLEELSTIFDDIDFKQFRQNPYQITNVISNMAWQEKTRSQAIKLFKRAWEEMPDQRSQLLQSMNADVFWQMPEIYDYARQGIIPASESALSNGKWPGFGQIQSWGNQDGKIVTLMSRFLSMASSRGKFDDLARDVKAAQEKVPQWEGGTALLAMLELRRGKIEGPKETFEKMLTTLKWDSTGQYTTWEIGQELLAHEKCTGLAIQYLELAMKDPNVIQMMQMNGVQYSPAKTLVALYKQHGRQEDARQLLLSTRNAKSNRNQGEAWEAYNRIQSATSLGTELKSLGYPVDSIRLYQEQLGRSEDFVVAIGVFGGSNPGQQIEMLKNQLQNGLQSALKELKPEQLPQLLLEDSKRAGNSPDPNKSTQTELFLLFESRDLDQIQLTSVFGKMVKSLGANPSLTQKIRHSLSESLAQRPSDMPLKVLEVLLGQQTKDTDASTKAVAELIDLVDRTPLEAPPAKGSIPPKQRDAARHHIGLWLVARECLKDDSQKENGRKLGERALEGARHQTDNSFALAILREWGSISLQAKDKDGAKKRWAEMLEIVVPKQADKSKSKPDDDNRAVAAATPAAGPATPANAVPAAAPVTSAAHKGPVITLAQFEKIAQISKLAIENGIEDLSFDAISLGLQSGPPVEAMVAIDLNQIGRNNPNQQQSQVGVKVYEQLATLERLWREKEANDASIYAALERAVLPESRSIEVFLHPKPLTDQNRNYNGNNQPPLEELKDIGALLAAAAVKANRVDRLKQLVEPRLKQPMGEIPGRVLLAQVAFVRNDFSQAIEQLTLLSERLKHDGSQTSSELVSHIAIPALHAPRLQTAATTLMEQVVDRLARAQTGNRNNNDQKEPMRTFRFSLARSLYQNNNPEAAKRQLEEYIASLSQMYQNYGGDYGVFMRKQEYLSVADEYARAGQHADLLDCLGRYADITVSTNYGGATGYSSSVLASLGTLPKSDRYEVLKKWTLPTDDRKSVRLINGVLTGERIPARFDSVRNEGPRLPQESSLFSTAHVLIESAKAANQLDQLKQAVIPLAEQNIEQSRFLLQLIQIAEGHGGEVLPALTALIEERKHPKREVEDDDDDDSNQRRNQRMNLQYQEQQKTELSDALLANAAIGDSALKEKGRELLAYLMNRQNGGWGQQSGTVNRRDYYSPELGEETARRLESEPWNAGLKYWTASSRSFPYAQSNGGLPSWWIANEGILCLMAGTEMSDIYFNYPIAGEFQITCDVWSSAWNQNSLNLGYDGTRFQGYDVAQAANYRIQRGQSNGNEFLKKMARIRHENFNQLRLEVTPKKIRYFVNGDLIHEKTKLTASSPWLNLSSLNSAATAVRNLKMSGAIEIPREVSLLLKDAMPGWQSDFYSETQPPAERETNDDEDAGSQDDAMMDADEYGVLQKKTGKDVDWETKDHILLGRKLPPSAIQETKVRQSRLYYHRPLLDGDRVTYEFWYERGHNSTHVHPTLGQMAFLLEPDGLNLHWMTSRNSEDNRYSLPTDNRLVDESIRKGPISLKEKDWNNVELSFKNDVVTINVNGKAAGELKFERENNRVFGFYHDKNATAVKVRNVVMRGDWPATIPAEAVSNPQAPSGELTVAQHHGNAKVIDEKFQIATIADRLLESRGLNPELRFKSLAAWVLPNDDHSHFRLYGTLTSANDIPGSDYLAIASPATRKNEKGRRQYGGPDLASPALELVTLAKELNRLDELKQKTEPAANDDSSIKRAKLALRTIVQIESGQFDAAIECLKQLPKLCETLADDTRTSERWPEFLAAHVATQHAETRSAALPLLTLMTDQFRKQSADVTWGNRVIALRDRCQSLIETSQYPPISGSSPRQQWLSARMERTQDQQFSPPSRWQIRDKTVSHLAGDGQSYLYFQSPLKGTFTVEAEVTTSRWNEPQLMYHGRSAGPDHGKKKIALGGLENQSFGPRLDPKLEFDEWCRLKLDVAPGKATYFINDRQVHEQLLPEKIDPWLALSANAASSGKARNIRISGSPEIPAELNLTNADDLIGWSGSLYSDPMNTNGNGDNSNNAWRKSENEIVGSKFDSMKNQKRQSLLRYHRPLAEDTDLTYEFYYAKDETHVHPAIGRLAMMIHSDGVKFHWLTDPDSDRYGLKPDNEIAPTTVTGATETKPLAKPELKDKAWNQVQIKIEGDTVQLTLNGQLILETDLYASNQRQFGFFHFANETEVKVRNVQYKGNWPKTLPSLDQQELSTASTTAR